MEKIKVIVCGAAGQMGKFVVKTVLGKENMELVGAVDVGSCVGADAGELATGKKIGVPVTDDIENLLKEKKPHVMVDFTRGSAAPLNIIPCLTAGCACVVGTTGISTEDMDSIFKKSDTTGVPVMVAPNFSLGAVLMMKFSKEAAKYFDWAEIIELHHENKKDAPSGTSLRTADLMCEEHGEFKSPADEFEKIPGVRGGVRGGIRIHSVRLQGLLAHQEVNLGAVGEVLKIRHDSISRESFMPGVMIAVEKIRGYNGPIEGLENIL